ncbi:MAG: hypothetical protein A2075_03440 [Geobacteraceae bacterium GWC2_58_44]|nr:MAG: hypothetical protein A2075_03440 [Geobacteraceae bacterium GWC2_58_44]HBG04450.1 hypothetical protein [Geobacter sp.]
MTVEIDGIEYLPAAAAAEQLATTETRILMLLKKDALCGGLIDGSWFVTTASLACYDPKAVEEKELACRTNCSGSGSGCGCH